MQDEPVRLYKSLISKDRSPEEFSTGQLFDLASQMAVAGQYPAKQRIYEDFILNHSAATEADKFRVHTYRYDVVRRGGRAERALAGLSAMEESSDDPNALVEYLQAKGQCYLMMGKLEECLESQRRIMQNLDQLPPDKQLYYLETFIDFKIRSEQADEELAQIFQRYKKVLDGANLQMDVRARAEGMYFDLQGKAHLLRREFSRAQSCYRQAVEKMPSVRNKAVSALGYAYSSLQANPEERDAETVRMIEFFKANKSVLQPTDLSAYADKIDFVEGLT